MTKIIKFPKAHVDDQEVYENIPADVAIAHNGEVATSGEGSVDAYRCSDFIGLTVTAHTGMSLYVNLPQEEAESLSHWILTGGRK